jgi:hypothetical protein
VCTLTAHLLSVTGCKTVDQECLQPVKWPFSACVDIAKAIACKQTTQCDGQIQLDETRLSSMQAVSPAGSHLEAGCGSAPGG